MGHYMFCSGTGLSKLVSRKIFSQNYATSKNKIYEIVRKKMILDKVKHNRGNIRITDLARAKLMRLQIQ